jgi:hypothetical protein
MLCQNVQTGLLTICLVESITASANLPRTFIHVNTETPWTRHDSIGLGPRQEHGVAAFDDRIFVIGGVRYNNNNTVETINLVEYFTIKDQKWHVAAPLPQAVNHPNTIAVDNKVYLLGSLAAGANWTALPDTYIYTQILHRCPKELHEEHLQSESTTTRSTWLEVSCTWKSCHRTSNQASTWCPLTTSHRTPGIPLFPAYHKQGSMSAALSSGPHST